MGLPQACMFQTCLDSVADFDDLEVKQMAYSEELRLQKAGSQGIHRRVPSLFYGTKSVTETSLEYASVLMSGRESAGMVSRFFLLHG